MKTYRFEQVREEGIDQTKEDHRCFGHDERFRRSRSGSKKGERERREGKNCFDPPVTK